jgi:hypothetical protein
MVKIPRGTIFINATTPEIAEMVLLYNGTLQPGDSLSLYLHPFVEERCNVTSDVDAPHVAQVVMEQYGGLPDDAVLTSNETNYIEEYNENTQRVEAKLPVMTSVSYSRTINGTPLVGHVDSIRLDLGDNNEVIDLQKVWRTLTYTGQNAHIIPPEKAIEKMQNGELLNDDNLLSGGYVGNIGEIGNISFAYYEKSDSAYEITYEPVWVFEGGESYGNMPMTFYIDATDFVTPAG